MNSQGAISQADVVQPRRRRHVGRHDLAPWLFVAPAAIIFAVYVVIPIFQSFWLSLFDWDGITVEKEFIGLANYEQLFQDEQFWTSLRNNRLLADFLSARAGWRGGHSHFPQSAISGNATWSSRCSFSPSSSRRWLSDWCFLGFTIPSTAFSMRSLGLFGFPPFAPLSDPNTVTFAIIAAGLWPQVSYCMILYLAGLTAVDPEQIEAGRLDGAKGFRMFWHIIMPQLRPATFIAVVITVVGALRSFDLVQVMTDGGPYGSSSILAFFMFQQSITNFRMGYGAAIAVVLVPDYVDLHRLLPLAND